ncbi:hypothetical protein OUZ56_027443 [Daphnia magna]|uniref:Uncharacterized protein n=1 Tax=Daphnia magna TaxID=35525 RepID=A0ABQ9ZPS7_9CRUS|nr:hypothetical protein OUZ56_027443 [Daphnia magna]
MADVLFSLPVEPKLLFRGDKKLPSPKKYAAFMTFEDPFGCGRWWRALMLCL